MLQFSRENVAKDFKLVMRVPAESFTRLHNILIDDTKGTKLIEPGVVVTGEAEGMVAVEPAVVGMATGFGTAGNNCSRHCVRERWFYFLETREGWIDSLRELDCDFEGKKKKLGGDQRDFWRVFIEKLVLYCSVQIMETSAEVVGQSYRAIWIFLSI